jgi:AraC family transcriptional regulator of adaptative response / DNA-3-methyladenine glycosylase II
MQLSRAQMLDRARARDARFDGRFLTGVLSTGIYCLPSCPARLAKPENVVHFARPEDARAAGLRACLRCRPDDFYRGYDPDEEDAAAIAREVVGEPARFADARAVAARTGVGMTKLHALFRAHLHDTPAAFLARARVRFACARLQQGARVLDAALDAGFDSQSAFYANFTPRVGMTPDAYRRLGRGREFVLELPAGYRTEELFAFHGRDPEGAGERVVRGTLAKAVWLDGVPAVLRITFAAPRARCEVLGAGLSPARAFAAHATAVRMLNLAADPADFEARARRSPLARLVRRRPGLRVPRTADAFEAVVWTVVGQQVNVEFAATLRHRLVARYGTPVAGLRAHPTPGQLAAADPAELRQLQFSGRKAEYLQQLAAAAAAGDLDLGLDLAEPAGRVHRRLRAQRGLGPWSASYALLRGFGFLDCAPVEDVGLQAALQQALALADRPDASAVAELLAPYAPWRSLATYHLWTSLADAEAPERRASRRPRATAAARARPARSPNPS